MIEKEFQNKQANSSQMRNPDASSSSRAVDSFDAERAAQREEFLKREKEKGKTPSQQFRPKKPRKSTKPKVLTFDQKLEITYQWLEETYPHLFAADDYILLDNLILRDLKIEYKNNALKKGYPQDLVIKAALSRHRERLGYLECIRAGAPRYNIKGESCGIVTGEEEEAAKKILAAL